MAGFEMTHTRSSLDPVFTFLASALSTVETSFNKLPGSAVIQRYVRSSHQNDPGRTILELILVVFAIRTLLQSRTRANQKGFIKFTDKEVDELVEEWIPEPLGNELSITEQSDLDAVPVISGPNGPKPKLASTGKTVLNLASLNFTGLAGNEHIKQRAVETLRKYGLGSCGPPGFYGTLDVHMDLERDIADFLGTEASILYSQGFSTVSSVIPAFCKRGDIIVADRNVNFAIQKGIQISRSTVRWYDHNDLKSLEEVLQQVEKERKKRRGPLTRRFIITEGIFERDGAMVDLPKLIELKYKYKYRLLLDESYSFGSVGRTGRGLTELYNVPASKVDMLLGSCAIAAMPALLAVSASEGINIFRSTPSIFEALQDNIRAARAILEKVDCVSVPSHPASPIVHITLKTPTAPPSASLHPSSAGKHGKQAQQPEWDTHAEERILQEVVEECLAQGVMVTRAKRLRGQEWHEPRPSIKLALTSALTRKETEKAVGVVKSALVKVVAKRR
ncbi:serine C-palmitoyltransferase [Coprinopsis sp. MPI-PUGE-AT-0042]|nr:serine C-palmitoyltransferase [Coprinopsis sp. MPI-PUGE-AT-0042]